MALTTGARVGPYEIVALLGAGGMGEVYRARDTNLGREVAIKILPDGLTHDAERLARFRREAQLLAALNHPHIASIYGLEESTGHRGLVLELVDGETLARRIELGPLPINEALVIARQIAEALEAAHARGIIHRDLKPANIALTSHDRVKVLDFGLAKATETPSIPGDADALNSPTVTSAAGMTGAGVILGTAAYMSPEQAKGRAADKRSDIWAFGCVLYEMLTGRRPFRGDDVSDTLAAVLRGDPDWSALPASLPPAIRALLEGCLAKNPHERIGDVSTLLFVLKHPVSGPVPLPPAAAGRGRTRTAYAAVALGGVLAGAGGVIAMWPRSEPAPAAVLRFEFPVHDQSQLTITRRVLAVSPDGTRIAYVADGRLYLRTLSDLDSRPIDGADPGVHPAFSPDGQSLAFWTDGVLKRVSVTGGIPVPICDTVPAPFGIHWSEHGIVFTEPGRGIMRISPNGGTPQAIVQSPDGLFNSPQLLPDGDTVLFTFARLGQGTSNFWDNAEIVAQSISTGRRTVLVRSGSDGRYLSSGHLAYMLEGTLMAVPFDVKSLAVGSEALPVVEGVRRAAPAAGYAAALDVSSNGTLVFVPGPARSGLDAVFVYDREGVGTGLNLPPGTYAGPRVSPDGKRLAIETSDGKVATVAIYDLSGASALRRLTFGGNNRLPIWSRDGTRLAFQSDREGDLGIFWQPVDGGPAERLTKPDTGVAHVPETWNPHGDTFLFSETKGGTSTLWTFSIRDRKATRFGDVTSLDFPTNAAFSADGRWVAYQAGEGGRGEASLFVQPYPPTGVRHQIAHGGRPQWSRTGLDLFFVPGPGGFSVVSISADPAFGFTPPAAVTRRFGLAPPGAPRPFDILPDGRFIVVDAVNLAGNQRSSHIRVVLNWFEELKAKLPAGSQE